MIKEMQKLQPDEFVFNFPIEVINGFYVTEYCLSICQTILG